MLQPVVQELSSPELAVREAGGFIHVIAARRSGGVGRVRFTGLPAAIREGRVLFEYQQGCTTCTSIASADEFRTHTGSLEQSTTSRRLEMSKVQAKLNIAQVGRVCIPISDTDRALEFYVDTLGFEKVVDVPMGPDMRWVEVSVAGTPTTIALAPPPPGQPTGGTQTGICLDTSDVDADHAALKAAGVDVDDEVARYGGPVPPMFWVRDPDGNSLIVVQPND